MSDLWRAFRRACRSGRQLWPLAGAALAISLLPAVFGIWPVTDGLRFWGLACTSCFVVIVACEIMFDRGML